MKEQPTSPERRRRAASLMLVVVTAVWGLSFSLMKGWQEAAKGGPGGEVLAALTMIGVRIPLALAALAVLDWRLFREATWREYAAGALIGGLNLVGFAIQVVGLAHTTPALSAFLTSLSAVWLPLLAFALFRQRVARLTLLGLALGVVGAAVLGIDPAKDWGLGGGEGLTLLASLVFGVVILLVDRIGRKVNSSRMTAGWVVATGVPSLLLAVILALAGPGVGPWLAWTGDMLRTPALLRDLALQTVLAGVLAVHWVNTYQPRVPAGRVALIYLLEPVWAAVFSLLIGHEEATWQLLLGGTLILGGNAVVELPAWLRDRAARQ